MKLGSIICIYGAYNSPRLKIYVGSYEQIYQYSYFIVKSGISLYEEGRTLLPSRILQTNPLWKPLD